MAPRRQEREREPEVLRVPPVPRHHALLVPAVLGLPDDLQLPEDFLEPFVIALAAPPPGRVGEPNDCHGPREECHVAFCERHNEWRRPWRGPGDDLPPLRLTRTQSIEGLVNWAKRQLYRLTSFQTRILLALIRANKPITI
jgi:hypothetical protein